MSEAAVVVEDLSKRYLIGHRFSSSGVNHRTMLRETIGREIRNFTRKATDLIHGRQVVQGDEIEEFWALRHVNFEAKQGEVLGIIGRNGAGKSTLLKILSRITEPTEGRVLLRGRISSLLEVGTGFHPELTGRENIFLNGAVLGMTQREIRKKFDEIVAFAEVERFLDTPVKRYSSGMYVRLAFAVAAHLEPEILVIDEVLAVGDVEFQKKCLGKMDEVSHSQGRTVLFVSHNMEAVLKLCNRAVFLESGTVRIVGDAKNVVAAYLHSQSSSPRLVDLSSKRRALEFPQKARLMKVTPAGGAGTWSLPFGKQLSLDLTVDIQPSVTRLDLIIGIFSARGFEVATWTNKCSNVELALRPGMNTFRIEYQHPRLLPGRYFLGFGVIGDRGYEDAVNEAVQLEITSSPDAAQIDAHHFGGASVASAIVSIVDQASREDESSAEHHLMRAKVASYSKQHGSNNRA
jgi:lipopolysaccharide transport system ATP-binding protein